MKVLPATGQGCSGGVTGRLQSLGIRGCYEICPFEQGEGTLTAHSRMLLSTPSGEVEKRGARTAGLLRYFVLGCALTRRMGPCGWDAPVGGGCALEADRDVECHFFRVAKLDNGSVAAAASGQGGAEAMVVMLPDRPPVNLPL